MGAISSAEVRATSEGLRAKDILFVKGRSKERISDINFLIHRGINNSAPSQPHGQF